MTGLLMEAASARTKEAAPSRGTCPLCRRSIAIKVNGMLRRHTIGDSESGVLNPPVCNGSGIAPSESHRPPVVRDWAPVDEFEAASGSRAHPVRVGDRCKVQGLGRGGAVGSGWTVISAERRASDGRVNVTVLRKDRSRIVPSDRIVWMRQPKRPAP